MFLFRVICQVIYYIIDLVILLIVARALLSWFPLGPDNKLIAFLDMMTEPFVAPIRKLLNKSETVSQLPIDFAPLIAVILLSVLSGIITSLVAGIA